MLIYKPFSSRKRIGMKMEKRKLFDTDGIRGVTNQYPMIPEVALRLGKAVAAVMGNGKSRPKILIGKDTRLSGYMFETAITSGLCSMGAEVLLVGPMPTPGVAHLTKSFAAEAGIVISASHNPAGHNGIKVFSNDGYKLPDKTELRIEETMSGGEINSKHAGSGKIGKARRIEDAKGRYIEYLKGCIRNRSLSGLSIVLDCANGAAYNISPHIFSELGASLAVLNNSPNGMNINLGCGALHPGAISKEVRKRKADIGIALDGDADRVIMVDERGEEVDGDHIMAIIALDMHARKELAKDTVVGTVMTNRGFDIAMEKHGIKVIKTRVGDRYVIEEMKKKALNFGGEQSGHIINLDYSTTGDGTLTALLVLEIMKRTEKPLSELAKCMESLPQVTISLRVREKKPIEEMRGAFRKIKETEKVLGSSGRVLVRYSGTEMKARVMIEGRDRKQIESCCREIAEEIRKEAGAPDGK